MSTAARIRRFILREVLADRSLPRPSGRDPLAEGGLDSLALEQVVSFLEETFGIEFTDEELVARNFESLDALSRLVDDKRRDAGGRDA